MEGVEVREMGGGVQEGGEGDGFGDEGEVEVLQVGAF